MKRLFLLCLFLSLIVSQSAIAQDFTIESFEAAGRMHRLRYEAGTEDLIEPSLLGLNDAAAVYIPLFDSSLSSIPFQIVLDIFTESRERDDIEADAAIFPVSDIPDITGDTIITETQACHIRVYINVITMAYARFTLAHELSHCFQDYYFHAAFEAGSLEASGWWVEGTAEWFASLVYPDLAFGALRDGVAEAEWIYAEQGLAVTDTLSEADFYAGYGAVYFWQHLADEKHPIEMLHSLTAAATTEENYQDFLVSQLDNPTDTMESFGLNLAQDALAFQPNSIQLYGISIPVTELPYAIPVELADFRVSLNAFYIAPIEGVTAVRIQTDGLDESAEIRVNINAEGTSYQRISDDAPATICLPTAGVIARLILSRGDGDSAAPFEVTMEAITEPEPDCGELPGLDVDMTCVIGSWRLTNDPVRQIAANQLGSSVSTGGSPGIVIVNIAEDGTISYSVDDYTLVIEDMAQGSTNFMQMDATLTGELALSPNLDGTILVSDFDWSISSLSALANINGFEMDMTDIVLGTADASQSLGVTPAQLQCIGDIFMDWWVVFDGREYYWHFTRVE
jgi:hypothetical protein